MSKVYVKVIVTTEGMYVAQARKANTDGTETTLFETSEYFTVNMAIADAVCWKAFHVDQTVNDARCDECTKWATLKREGRYLCDDCSKTEEPGEFDIEENDRVYNRSGKSISGREFAAKLARIIDTDSPVKYEVFPIKNGRKGFHLNIKVGNTPIRKFTIIKEENSGASQ
jgi:DNA-directed RNA polymerase subunit RPC12/RpoP